jgi:hypothetical protein
MRLYYHKTDGGAEYLSDTFIECRGGHREGDVNDKTQFVVRIDGDIAKDAELNIRDAFALLQAGKAMVSEADDWLRSRPSMARHAVASPGLAAMRAAIAAIAACEDKEAAKEVTNHAH